MQKVEGSNPFSRFTGEPRSGGVFFARQAESLNRTSAKWSRERAHQRLGHRCIASNRELGLEKLLPGECQVEYFFSLPKGLGSRFLVWLTTLVDGFVPWPGDLLVDVVRKLPVLLAEKLD